MHSQVTCFFLPLTCSSHCSAIFVVSSDKHITLKDLKIYQMKSNVKIIDEFLLNISVEHATKDLKNIKLNLM